MTATLPAGSIVRALRAAHLHDAPRDTLLRLACEAIRGLGPPYTSAYAYMLHGDELVLEAFSGRDTEHRRIPVGTGVGGTAVGAARGPEERGRRGPRRDPLRPIEHRAPA